MHVFLFCSQPQFLDVGLELESAHMGAHLAAQSVTGECMKAKPNESTHSQNLPANICPILQLQPTPFSRQSKTTQLPFSSLFFSLEFQVYMIFYVLHWALRPLGFGNLSKNVVCNFKTTGISESENEDFFSLLFLRACFCRYVYLQRVR